MHLRDNTDMKRKEERRGLASNEDCTNGTIQGFEEILITAACNYNNITTENKKSRK